jgi:hypothetical protein
MNTSTVWNILRKFKALCSFRGWKTSESEDWIEKDDQYHNFLWTRDVKPSTFERIVTDAKCVVKEGLSYRVVEAAYTAWLFSRTPSENLVKTVFENSDFSKRIALYDLSPLLVGKKTCVKVNNTESTIFQEFEKFLQEELNIKLNPLSSYESYVKTYAVTEPV